MRTPLKVGVYALCKNEEKHVERFLRSVEGFEDVTVLDTGSTDGTLDLLNDAHTHGYLSLRRARFDPFRFDDARNTALSLMPDWVDVCLHVDLDEVVEAGWRDELEDVGVRKRYRYTMINGGSGDWHTVPRSNFHARWGFRWKHPIHEVIYGSPPEHDLQKLTITHLPDNTKPRTDYLPMLQQAVREEPDDPRMAFYYARELSYRGLWDQARTQFVRFLALKRAVWPAERCEAYRHIAQMKDVDPERWFLKAKAEEPRRREPWVDLARLYLDRGWEGRARGEVLGALERTDMTLYTTSRNAWGNAFQELVDAVGVL